MWATRREFLIGASAASMALAPPAWSSLGIGEMQVQTLRDGYLDLPGDFVFAPMPQGALQPVLDGYGLSRDRLTPECNVTLLRDGDRVVLFDAGAGPNFMQSAGRLLMALDAAGVAAQDVTQVVFTHGHPDHLWGVLDDFGEVAFPNAGFLMGARERDYWMSDQTVSTIAADRQSMAVGAKRRLELLGDRVATFDDGEEILPGVLAHASFGHTPGHMSFELRSGNEALMLVGDAIGNHHVAFAHPDWPSGADQDQETAIATRLRLFDILRADDMRLIGFHLPSGGIGRADRHDDGFVFVPENRLEDNE